MNKLVCLGWSILNVSKFVIYEFWYDYLKRKYGENSKLGYMDTSRFIVNVGADDIYKNIAEDVETTFGTSHFESDRSLTNEKSKSIVWLMKDELGRQIAKEFLRLRTKIYSYLKDNNEEDKNQKARKSVSLKKKTYISML